MDHLVCSKNLLNNKCIISSRAFELLLTTTWQLTLSNKSSIFAQNSSVRFTLVVWQVQTPLRPKTMPVWSIKDRSISENIKTEHINGKATFFFLNNISLVSFVLKKTKELLSFPIIREKKKQINNNVCNEKALYS